MSGPRNHFAEVVKLRKRANNRKQLETLLERVEEKWVEARTHRHFRDVLLYVSIALNVALLLALTGGRLGLL